MEEKGIQGLLLTTTNFFIDDIPMFLLCLFDIVSFPFRLVLATIIPDALLF